MSIHEGHRKRTKEEFLERPETFPDHRVMELLLFYANPRGDTNPLAHSLIRQFGSFAGVMDALPEELKKVPGIGDHAVVLLQAVKEANRRYLAGRVDPFDMIESLKDIEGILAPRFYGSRVEKAFVMCLDARGKILGIRQISEGTVGEVDFYVRKVAEVALSLNAAQVVLAHNHPSGVSVASEADMEITQAMAIALAALGIGLLDHVIFTDNMMTSLLHTPDWEEEE